MSFACRRARWQPGADPPRRCPCCGSRPRSASAPLVEMNNPGVWVLGEVRKHVQALGMAIAVEYAEPGAARARWQQPSDLIWNYEQFAAAQPADGSIRAADRRSARVRIEIPRPRQPWRPGRSTANPIPTPASRRSSGASAIACSSSTRARTTIRCICTAIVSSCAASARRSTARAAARAPKDIRGIIKDVVLVDSQTRAEVEFTADNPGATLFHCHQQNHMDLGFMMLFDYA